MKQVTNDMTYTVKLKRIDIIKLCIILNTLVFSEDEYEEGTRDNFKKIRDQLHEQYVAEDNKRMKEDK